MPLSVTLGGMIVSFVLAAFCLWRGLSATKVGRVRLVPWTPLGLFFLVVAFMLLVHVANLFGMETGRGR